MIQGDTFCNLLFTVVRHLATFLPSSLCFITVKPEVNRLPGKQLRRSVSRVFPSPWGVPPPRRVQCRNGLQNCLNTLLSFSSSYMLEVNSKKTKIMIFQKRAKKVTDNFHTGKDVIVLVHEYTYLGTRTSSNGNFTVSQEDLHLKDKAHHPLFSLRKHRDLSKLKPSLACKIFEAMI